MFTFEHRDLPYWRAIPVSIKSVVKSPRSIIWYAHETFPINQTPNECNYAKFLQMSTSTFFDMNNCQHQKMNKTEYELMAHHQNIGWRSLKLFKTEAVKTVKS